LENYLPPYKTRLDELADDEKELYNTLFGGSFESDRQAAIERAAFYERMSNAAKAPAEELQAESEDRGFMGAASDLGLSVAAGAANLGGAVTQAADMASRFIDPVGRMTGDMISEQAGLPTSDDVFDAGRRVAGEAEDYLSDKKSDYSKAQAQNVANADGFIGTVKAYGENPGQIAEGIAGSLPYMFPIGAAARAAKAAGMGAASVTGVTAGAGAVLDGGAAGAQANSEIMDMAAGDLLELSPDYASLIQQGVDPDKAKSIVASRAGLTAQALQMPVSFLASKLSGAAKLESDFFTGNMAKGWVNGVSMLAREGAEEVIQEGANQASVNTGVKLFGDQNREVMEGVPEAAASGMVIGAGQAAGMQGTGWAVNKVFGDPAPVNPNDDDGIDLPTNGEQLGGGIVDDMPQSGAEINRPVLREAGNPNDPNDRFKFELDTDSFVSNLRRRIDERKNAEFAQKLAPQVASAEPEQETTLADVARKFGEENGLIQKPITYDGGVNFERVPVPAQQAPVLSLAPLDQPQGGIDFAAPRVPARTEQLASGVEKAIAQNIDKARNSRMPENLKDVRLLRSRYRTHLNDVATGIDSNAGAFEKADSLLEMAAKNGGLNADAWVSEGVDPADLKTKNGSAFTKAFRADGGMTPDDLAEFAAQNGFAGFTDDSGAPVSGAAVEAILGELSGNQRYSSADESKLQSAQAAPAYVKELAEFGSPAEIKNAVTKALNGEKLGARQAIIVQEVLDSTNRFKRDDSAVIEKWEKRARTMLSNKGNRELDQWRNRDEHATDATTEEAALNELMTDAMVQHGIDPDSIKSAYDTYAKQYPDSTGKLTYAMLAWVSANKPNTSEQPNERQVPIQRSPGERGAIESGAGLSLASQAEETAAAPSRIEVRAPAESGSDSAGRDAGLRQPVDLPEGWDKSLIKARRIAKSLDVPAYNTMRLGALAEAIRAKQSAQSEIDTVAAEQAATSPLNDLPEPTQAQKEAGNYKKAHVKVQGLDIAIENARGSTRSGQDPKGKKWSVDMQHHYGYIKRTEGADGDHVDAFIGPNTESDKVFIVDQVNTEGSFDEHKVMLGFDSESEATEGYKSNYSNGWKVGPITSMSMDEFKDWVKNGDTKKPLALNQSEQLLDMVPTSVSAPKADQGPVKKAKNEDVLYSLSDKRENKESIARETAQAIIDRISKDWKVPVKIKLIDTIADLPNSIKSRMSKTDDEGEPAALIDESTGHVYINLSKVESERSIEELVFHEVYTHFGLRQLMGDEVGPVMRKLYFALGAAEVNRLAEKYGVNVAAYEKAYEGRSIEMRQAIIAEELLAHMSEHTKPSVVKFAQELVGAVRSWLRKNGFAELAKINDADMRYLLKQARETVTKGKNGDFTGLIYSLAGVGKADRKAMNKIRKQEPLPEATEDVIEGDELLTAWALISQREDSFQLPTSRKKELIEIAQDIEGMNGFIISEADELALQNDHGAENAWRIKTPGGDKAAVYQKGDKVWIDVSDLESGDAGKRIYNIVANYAINTDRVFQGDPAGLSIMAKSRRLENMLSSAMKFGTTRHLQPHKLQLKDDAGVPALKWKKGDDVNNIREMIITSYEAVKNQFPKVEDLTYNPEKDIFEDSTNGREFTRQDFRRLAETARGMYESGTGGVAPSAGRTTLERAVLTHAVLRGTSSEKSRILEQLSGQRSERLTEILYALPKTRLTGGFSFGGSKTPRGATLPHQLKDAYNQLGGANKTLFEKVKTEVRRQLAPRGLLPTEIFDLKIARDGAMNSDDSQQRFILKDFYAQVQEVYKKPYHELKAGTRKEINDYLKGDRTNVQLTASMIDVLAKMRTQIQSLSKSYMDQLLLDAANLEADGKLEAAAAKRALIETITDNFDNYLHRSYRAFDDPDWPKKVPENVYQDAVNLLAREYSGSATPDAAAIEKATKKVDLILHEGTAYDSMGRFISESKLGSRDLSVLKKRKQISPEIRALLGEYEDPAINYAKSVSKMTRLVHNTSFLRQMTDISLQLGYIFEEGNRPVGANKKIAADASEVYAPLNGMYTYPEFEQALRDAVGSSKEPDWYKVLVAANGAVKYGKTVLAPTTAVRNFLSASMFALTSGHWNASHLEKSVKVVKTYFTGKVVRGSREYVNKLLKLGVLYDAPNYRELQDLIKSVNESEHWLATGTRKSGLGKALNYAQEFYALGDDFWKILGFENEKAMLIKHYKMSEAAAEKEAAERIRNTYPTYSLTGKGIQTLRRFPVIGSFPSFPAEIIRTTFHKFRYFHKDAEKLGYANPAVLAKGVGLALGAGMMSGLSALSAAMFGVDDDEEEAIRQMLPEWSKNSSLFFLGRDDKGQVQYMDLGWLDPYGYWKKPLAALARDADAGDRMGDAAWEALSPFLGLDIAVGAVGEYIYDSFFNDSITAEKAAEKVIKGLAPGVVNNILGFWESAHDTVTKSGKKYTFEDETLALLGFRRGTLNSKVGLTYQAYGYADKKRQAATVLREKATDMSKVDIDELRSAYEKSMGMQRNAWDDMRRTVKMAMKTGMTQSEAVAALRTSGMSYKDAKKIVSDGEFVYRPSKTMMKQAITRAGILFDEEAQKELRERQKSLQELQREYMEKPVR
jgi:hypothetical protein